jgi:ABC-2 type transport system permease protein
MSERLPSGFRRVWRRELRRITGRPRLGIMLLPFPVILMALMAVVFAPGIPRDLPVAVVDHDRSDLSREVVRMVDVSSGVAVAAQMPELSAARHALITGQVYGVIQIPSGFERDLLSARQPELVTLYNNQFLTIGGIVSRASAQAFASFGAGAGAQALISSGKVPEHARIAVQPIPVQQSPLFNPALDYVQFLLASLMPAVLQIFMTGAAALVIAQDIQHHQGAARLRLLGGSAGVALLAKLLPYGLAYSVALFIADAVMFGFFDAPFNGSLWLHFGYTLLFVISSLALGAVLACVAGDTLGALGMTGVLTGPAFGFAGVSFPRLTMNGFAYWWGALIPLTPYLELRTDQVLRGTPIAYSLPTLWGFALQAGIYLILAVVLFQKAANRPPEAPEVSS